MNATKAIGALGFVGYLTGVNVEFLRSLWRAGVVPVASCMGLGADGELYNINADHMAAAAAEYIHADRLIYMTDVAGVLDGDKVLQAVKGAEIEDLIRRNKVSGGMILKLEAASGACGGREPKCASWAARNAAALLTAANGGKRARGRACLPVIPLRQAAGATAQGDWRD